MRSSISDLARVEAQQEFDQLFQDDLARTCYIGEEQGVKDGHVGQRVDFGIDELYKQRLDGDS